MIPQPKIIHSENTALIFHVDWDDVGAGTFKEPFFFATITRERAALWLRSAADQLDGKP